MCVLLSKKANNHKDKVKKKDITVYMQLNYIQKSLSKLMSLLLLPTPSFKPQVPTIKLVQIKQPPTCILSHILLNTGYSNKTSLFSPCLTDSTMNIAIVNHVVLTAFDALGNLCHLKKKSLLSLLLLLKWQSTENKCKPKMSKALHCKRSVP